MIGTVGLWAVNYAIHSTILIALAAIAVRFMRSAALRDVIWKVVLVAAIFSASLQTLIPSLWRIEWTRRMPASPAASIVPAANATARPLTPSAVAAPAERPLLQERVSAPMATPADPSTATIDPLAVVTVLWGAGALLFMARLLAGRRRMMRSFGERVEVSDAADLALLDELRASAGCRRPVRLTASALVPSPFATAAFEICVPVAAFASMTGEQKRALLSHELAHLVRRDPQWLNVSEVLKAILFFQPLNAFVQRQLRDASEFLCDDFVIVQTGERLALAESLAELATRVGRTALPLAAMGEGRSRLVERVARLLEPERTPEREAGWGARSAVAGATLLAVTVAVPAITPAAVATPRAQRTTIVSSPSAAPAGGVHVVSETVTAPPRALASSPRTRTVVSSSRSHSASDSAASRVQTTTRQRASGSFSDVTLSHDTGDRHVRAEAHHVDVSRGGAVEFQSSDGYVRVHETGKSGRTREVEVRPGRNGQVRTYTIDGRPVPWNDEARELLADAFVTTTATAPPTPVPPVAHVTPVAPVAPLHRAAPRPAVAPQVFSTPAAPVAPRSPIAVLPKASTPRGVVPPRAPASRQELSWRSNVDDVSRIDGVEVGVKIRVTGLTYTLPDATVQFSPLGRVVVEERIGGKLRKFEASRGQLLWSGNWAGATQADREEWLVDVVGRHSDVEEAIIRALARG